MALIYKPKLGRVRAGRPEILRRKEAASATFEEGELVASSGGYLAVCGTNPAKILGISMQAGHNGLVGVNSCDVLVANVNTLFLVQVHHATPANAVIEATDLDSIFGVTISGHIWYIDKAKVTTDARFKIVEFFDPVGTLNGRVYAQALTTFREID